MTKQADRSDNKMDVWKAVSALMDLAATPSQPRVTNPDDIHRAQAACTLLTGGAALDFFLTHPLPRGEDPYTFVMAGDHYEVACGGGQCSVNRKLPEARPMFRMSAVWGCGGSVGDANPVEFVDSFADSATNKALACIPTTLSDWDVPYNGYGSVSFDDATKEIILKPQAATSPDETHAALALLKCTEQSPSRDFTMTVDLTTLRHLRTPAPNPWECLWIVFNYNIGSDGKKETNYFILKPNGIELGTAYGEMEQNFLATDSNPKLTLGIPNQIVITKHGQQLSIMIDGKLAMEYDGTKGPKPLYDVPGAVGLYIEDAEGRGTISLQSY